MICSLKPDDSIGRPFIALHRPFNAPLCTSPPIWNALFTIRARIEPISCPACSRTHLGCRFLMLALGSSEFFFSRGADRNRFASTGSVLVSVPHSSWAYNYPNAIGPNAINDAHHSYYAVDSNIMSLGFPGIHSTPFNQGLAPHLASHPYSASTIEGLAPLHDYSATDLAYGTASMAYGATSAVYDTTSAAYGAGTGLGDLTKGIRPPTDSVPTLMAYDDGVTDINPGIYSPVPNPTLAPGTITTVQGGHESAVADTDSSRPRCSTCNTTFKRASDLARHQKKHQPDRPFKCLVPRCNFKGAYRKDKLDAHVKSRHQRGTA